MCMDGRPPSIPKHSRDRMCDPPSLAARAHRRTLPEARSNTQPPAGEDASGSGTLEGEVTVQIRQIVPPALLAAAAACALPVGDPPPSAGTPAAPAITSFSATPASITSGQTARLTASFSNGIGSVDQGIGLVTSGVAVTVAPSVTS